MFAIIDNQSGFVKDYAGQVINSQYVVALMRRCIIIFVTMKVLVYGSGAVGLGLASCLLKSRAEVCLVARAETVAALRQSGLVRTGIFGRFAARSETFSAYESLSEIGDRTFDYILVCTKSFDSAIAAEDLSRHPGLFGEQTKIVLCQNGWGNAEKFVVHFPKQRVYSSRVITGFTRRRPNEVEITVHADAVHIGSLYGSEVAAVEPLAKAIAEGGIPCGTVADIEKDLWAKMLYNCALNPLGAILDVPYGALAENSLSRDLMNHIVEEVFRVMTAAGFHTHWQSAEGFLKVFYDRLVPDTARHKSSTLQDIAGGKKTEIDALTGAVMELAGMHRIPIPYNHTIYNLIRFIEPRYI
jgi:2-dehydropantoate 2-reductase